MSTTNIIRAVTPAAPQASTVSIKLRISATRRAFTRRLCKLFAGDVVGNPLHEAWTADGEPLERMTPADSVKSCTSRHLIVPHSRGR
jgi:hypothetical protein